MKKYFIVSDIHGFFSELIDALQKSKFDIKNKNHYLIVCGDIFDRGYEPDLVYTYLKELKEKYPDRVILIRGNHEHLLREALKKDYLDYYDYTNGTALTIDILDSKDLEKEVISWIFKSKDWVNYYEIKDYIFVHSFIPVKSRSIRDIYELSNCNLMQYKENWRDAKQSEWERATWGCPYLMNEAGLNKTGKTIVCGHWHASDFHKRYNGEVGCNDIYYGDKIIAIDACTVRSRKVNVLVIEENEGEK